MDALWSSPAGPAAFAADQSWLLANGALAVLALAIALSLRPWRCVGTQGPPWPWSATWVVMLLLWSGTPSGGLFHPMIGVTLLVLMAGWPLAVLAMLGAATLTVLIGTLTPHEALWRMVWIGFVPATCVLAVGAAVRRWLPHHLFAYILGRGYAGTLLASLLASGMAVVATPAQLTLTGTDLLVAGVLLAAGEAGLCGTLVAILAALRPQWLATYAERLYLPP
jgi:uncharacterized membrane protein